jgi:hypothetical protein
VDQGESSANADCAENESIPKKVLRSNFNASTGSMSTAVSKSEHVLPPICIICKKEKVYHLDRVSLQLIVFISHIFCVEMHQSVLTYLPIGHRPCMSIRCLDRWQNIHTNPTILYILALLQMPGLLPCPSPPPPSPDQRGCYFSS